MAQNLYELVTSKIIAALDHGVVPWKKPWHVQSQIPVSLTANKPYRGVNSLLLGLAPYEDHRWLTFKQIGTLGGQVKRGEKSTQVVFWKFPEPSSDDEESKKARAPLLRYYSVFNVEQTEGLNVPALLDRKPVEERERIVKADLLVKSMPNPPRIEETGTAAWYKPSQDLVQVPKIENFSSSDQFYLTLLHELGHATGHKSRLNRKGVTDQVHFGSGEYSKEELVAELTAAFCAAEVSLDNSLIGDSASYIASWLKVLRNDPKAIVFAAAQAQKAADYIKGAQYGASNPSQALTPS
ncbi:MAG: zincin-like metallopeptidase domain-containing protein [Armatimonadota bacterium]